MHAKNHKPEPEPELPPAPSRWSPLLNYCGITTEVIWLTPELATAFLATMVGNRPLSQVRIDRLAAAIIAGRFFLNAETIKFDPEGHMVDGQHRCAAVIKAGIAVQVLVARNVPPEAFSSIDQGRNRSDADILSIADGDIEAPKLLAAALRLVMWFEANYSQSVRHALEADRGKLLEAHERHPLLGESVSFCGQSKFRGLLRPSVAAFAHYIGKHFASHCQPDEFWLSVSDGTGLVRGSPALALREYCRRRHGDASLARHVRGLRLTALLEAEVCIRAWNAHCEGVYVHHIQTGDLIPPPFGSPYYGSGGRMRQTPSREVEQRQGRLIDPPPNGAAR